MATTATPTTLTPPETASRPGPAGRMTFTNVVRSEWTKFRTVRSSFFTLAAAVVLGLGLGALISLAIGSHYGSDPQDRLTFDPTIASFRGLFFSQLALGVLGVLVMTSEYSTGMIRTSLTAVPRRSWLLASKALVFTTVSLVVAEILSFIAWAVGQAILSSQGAPTASLGQAQVLRAVIGAGLYLAAVGLLGVMFGALLRNTAAAITSLVALLFVLPAIAQALPSSWRNPVEKFWPTQAGQQILAVHRDAHTLSAWAGFGVMCLFIAIVATVTFWLIERRDA